LAGGGGVIENPNGSTLLSYAWGLGTETNNRAEALALWQGLNQAINNNIQELVIIGDSRIVIKALIHHSKLQNEKLNNLLDKIHLLLRKLRSFKIYHVLRKLNEREDTEANKGSRLTAGTMHLNGTTTKEDMP
jgi:ribonuclease HI